MTDEILNQAARAAEKILPDGTAIVLIVCPIGKDQAVSVVSNVAGAFKGEMVANVYKAFDLEGLIREDFKKPGDTEP